MKTSDNKIITPQEVTSLSEDLRNKNKNIVLVGGCFDILHVGHLEFLQKAKEQGDILMILLESDEAIRASKGENRPINTQRDRAILLQALAMVDAVILLQGVPRDTDYDQLILAIKPAIIATTKHDPYRKHKERQASLSGSKVLDVISVIQNQSTSRIAHLLKNEL